MNATRIRRKFVLTATPVAAVALAAAVLAQGQANADVDTTLSGSAVSMAVPSDSSSGSDEGATDFGTAEGEVGISGPDEADVDDDASVVFAVNGEDGEDGDDTGWGWHAVDTEAPYEASFDSSQLPDGEYDVAVVVHRRGKTPTVRYGHFTIDNGSSSSASASDDASATPSEEASEATDFEATDVDTEFSGWDEGSTSWGHHGSGDDDATQSAEPSDTASSDAADDPAQSEQPSDGATGAPSEDVTEPADVPSDEASEETSTETTTEAAEETSDSSDSSTFVEQVIELTNEERTSAGCSALTEDDTLDAVALAHSEDMAENDYFEHESQDGSTPFDRMTEAGYVYTYAAENIAAGYTTPEDVVEGWMNSEGHRENILNCNLTEIGVGYATGGTYGTYWTQDFGTPAS